MAEGLSPDQVYLWELEFEDGSTLRQGERGLNPNRPPADLGRVTRVRLVPQISGRDPVEVYVPLEARPVCHKLVQRENGVRLVRLIFRIGWRVPGARYLVNVDADSGMTWESHDKRG